MLRGLLAAVVALPLVGAAAACGDGDDAASDGKVKLSIFWWGGEARAQLTEQALDLYTKKNPDVTFEKVWQANQGYFDKLATLTAGGNPPDIFQIDDNYLAEYAARNATLDLKKYQDSGDLDTSKFPPSLLQYGEVDGKLAGVAAGENTQGLVYNKTLLTKNGLPEPTTGMSWEEHIAWAEQVSKKTKVPGTQDPSADYKAFWVWLRQQGTPVLRQRTGLHRRGRDQVVRAVEGRPGPGCHADPGRHPRGQRHRHHQAARGDRQVGHLLGLGQPDAGAEEEHRRRVGRHRVPG